MQDSIKSTSGLKNE